jgi:hypothetical protein
MPSTITVSDGTTSFDYVLFSMNESEAMYREDTSELSEPRTARESHELASTDEGSDRHLFQFARTDDDADGVPHTATVHTVFSVPRKGPTIANVKLEWNKLKAHIDAKIDDFLAGLPTGS